MNGWRVSVGLLLMILAVRSGHAQIASGTISGMVKDSSGAVIPGANVSATNTGTGASRSGVTGADGSYKFSALPLGNYDIRAEHTGFQSEVKQGLTLNVGEEAVISFTLQIGAVGQTVAVTAEAPIIETNTATVSGLVAENEVRDLPLNARNLVELATLFPGVTIAREAGQGVPNGFATKLAIVGTRYNASLFQLDGADINDATGSAGGAAGILMGVETIREFNVVTSGYSAEFGKHTGGIFNAVTKSGTNQFHGSVFEFFRNDNLDAARWEDNALAKIVNGVPKTGVKPEFKRNQYGGTIGGKIRADKLFFFGSYEALRERLGITRTFSVPDAASRLSATINPAIRPFLDSYPLPTSTRPGATGIGDYTLGQTLPTDEHFFNARVDQTISEKDSLFVRYTVDDAGKTINTSFNANTANDTRTQYGAISQTHLMSPQIINVALFAYNRSIIAATPVKVDGAIYPTDSFTDREGPLGNISVTGLGTWGGSSTSPSVGLINQYQFKDDVYVTKGTHSIKLGFNVQRAQYLRRTFFNGGGQFNFTSLQNFLAGTVSRFTGMPLGSDPSVYPRQTLYGMYVQDDVRVSSRLTLNLGLRYEFVTTPNVLNGRISNLHNYLTPGQTLANLVLGNPLFLNPSLLNFAPRVGFAWDPTGTGRTSIRGGAGIFHDQILPGPFLFSYVSTPPFFRNADMQPNAEDPRPVPFPNAWFVQQERLLAQPQVEPFQYKAEQPAVYKYSADIQRAISASSSFEVGFAGTRATHLFRVLLTNVPFSETINGRLAVRATTPLVLIHPGFSRVRPKQSDTTSDYFGLRMSFNQRMTKGLMFRTSYTWAKAIDESSSYAGSADFGNNPGNSRYKELKDPGLSAFDVRHALTSNFTYDFPWQDVPGIGGKFVTGWQISGILTAQSGTPFTLSTGTLPTFLANGFVGDFPDQIAPVKYDTRNPDRYFDPTSFVNPPNSPTLGFIGNAGRNTVIGPGLATLNVVFNKRTPLAGERVHLQFRTELHNILNRPNFGQPNATLFNAQTAADLAAGTTTYRADAARIVDTDTTSRQLQFGLKVEF
jgi:hypothetical protein